MTKPVTPEAVIAKLRELEARVEVMERTNLLSNSSLKNAFINVYDTGLVLRVIVGKLPNGLYGIRTYNAGGVQTNETSG